MECMFLLLIGVSLIQIKPGESYFENSSMWGLFICLMMAILSAGAGIYTELIIKRAQEKSLHVQNIQLYAFGMICNVLLYWFWENTEHLGNFFEGLLSFKSICVITTTVLSGLSVSMLLKYADNIVKVYSSGLSVIFTAFYCMLYLDFDPTLLFWCGTIVIVVSIDIYYMKMAGGGGGSAPAAAPSTNASKDIEKEKEKDGLADILVDKDAADKK
jgi:UDP-sugar transporter A1/2/3